MYVEGIYISLHPCVYVCFHDFAYRVIEKKTLDSINGQTGLRYEVDDLDQDFLQAGLCILENMPMARVCQRHGNRNPKKKGYLE